MKVSGLIEFLKTQPQDLEVVYMRYSEQVLMGPFEITVETLGEARPDGWVANARPDKPTKEYLCFPGN
jgi:hypothetical protein